MSNSLSTDALKEALANELTTDVIDYDRIYTLAQELVGTDEHNVRFSVDARLIHKLGYELVGKQETALGELIKNAYDADATFVSVVYENYDIPGGTLTIIDNGSGMSEQRIRAAWMRLSTSEKIEHPVSPVFHRARAGRKGIGRLAVERLGKSLLLQTGVQGEEFGHAVSFHWDDALTQGADLGGISFKIEKLAKDRDGHGTTLIIKHLRDRWTDSMLDRVWASVIFLQSPFKVSPITQANPIEEAKDPGFRVEINGKASSDVIKEISIDSNFLDLRLAKISGTIDGNGVATARVSSPRLELDESQEFPEKLLLVGETSFEASYFIYRSDLIPGMSVKTAQTIGSQYGGIRIYRNGFRVLPYGEPSDDWLRLAYDVARRNILSPVSNNNLFGQVEISLADNPLLEETSSREGLIENEAYDELKQFVRASIEWAVQRIASTRKTKNTASQRDWTKRERPSVILQNLVDQAEDDREPAESPSAAAANRSDSIVVSRSALMQAVSGQKSYEAEVAAEVAEHVKYEEMLRILASMGISISVFSHEIGGALNGVDASLVLFKENSKDSPLENSELLETVEQNMQRLRDLSGYINSLIGHAGSREVRPVPLNAAIKGFIKEFKNFLNAKGIVFEASVAPPYLRTAPMHRSEIDSVLFNFLTNSVKAIGRKLTADRRISITASERNGQAVIRFQDTGDGIGETIKERIFDAFFTTGMYNPEEPAGTGTGLGLKIVSDIAAANGGNVRVVNPDPQFNSCLEFSVPQDPNQIRG